MRSREVGLRIMSTEMVDEFVFLDEIVQSVSIQHSMVRIAELVLNKLVSVAHWPS